MIQMKLLPRQLYQHIIYGSSPLHIQLVKYHCIHFSESSHASPQLYVCSNQMYVIIPCIDINNIICYCNIECTWVLTYRPIYTLAQGNMLY